MEMKQIASTTARMYEHLDVLRIVKEDKRFNPITIHLALTNKCNLKCEFCHAENTPILMGDLIWKPIQEIIVGDMVLGLDKDDKWVKSKVTKTFNRKSECIELKTANGSTICSKDHKWREHHRRWRKASVINYLREVTPYYRLDDIDTELYQRGWLCGMILGDGTIYEKECKQSQGRKGTYIKRFFRLAVKDKEIIDRFKEYYTNIDFPIKVIDTYNLNFKKKHCRLYAIYCFNKDCLDKIKDYIEFIDDNSFMAGFLGGIFDAEGSYSCNTLRIANQDEYIKDKIKESLSCFGFDYIEEKQGIRIRGGTRDAIRFFTIARPVLKRKIDNILGHQVYARHTYIIDKIPKGIKQVFNIETDTGNYIANGFISKNCSVKNRSKMNELDFETDVKDIVDIYYELGVKSIEITGGGDPTMYPDLEEVIYYIKGKGLDVGLITNGLRLNKIGSDALKRLTWLRISLSGIDFDMDDIYYQIDTSRLPDFVGCSYVFNLGWPRGKVLRGILARFPNFVFSKIWSGMSKKIQRINEVAKHLGSKYIRIVPNCFTSEDIEWTRKVAPTFIDKYPEMFMQIKEYNVPRLCYWKYFKPFINADGFVYQCSTCALFEGRFPDYWKVAHWSEVEKIYQMPVEPFDNSRCTLCFYSKQNDILADCLVDVKHPSFI